jgi:hypothetical protein
VEQRENDKFCSKLDKMPIANYELLKTICDNEALSSSSVFEWFKRFKDGREYLQDDPRSERPTTSRNADTVANVGEIVI